MKFLFRWIVFLTSCLLLIACEQSVNATPSPIPSPSATGTSTVTFVPSSTATAAIEPTARPPSILPTLIPTFDPTLLPELLKTALSIQTVDLNGYNARRITGWDYGFGTVAWYVHCPGYIWLDSNHILLHPIAGQITQPIEMEMRTVGVVPQPVVINLTSGATWLPPVDTLSGALCNSVHWSRDLNILITTQIQNEMPTVSTYTYEGNKLTTYQGEVMDVSPRGTKILMTDNTVIDLQSNQKIQLNWRLEDYREQYFPENFFWTSDETRIYKCCYFYADLVTGTSHRFKRSDFQTVNTDHLKEKGLGFYRGQWVRDDTFFLVWWSYLDDGDIRYLPMFDPAKKVFYDVRAMAGISPDLTCPETSVSPNGEYVWIMCYEVDYLVNLFNFETTAYPGYSQVEMNWSADGQFAWINDFLNDKAELLSISTKELSTLSAYQVSEPSFQWHPTDGFLASFSTDHRVLELLNAKTMSTEELALPLSFLNLIWSPTGKKIALVAEDSSLWQIDFPTLDNLEQLTTSLPNVYDVNWSPDGNSIVFVSESDIYIIEVGNTTP